MRSRGRLGAALILAIVGFAFAPLALGQEGRSEFNVFLGQKFLDESDWSPLENQQGFGFQFSPTRGDLPYSFAIDVLFTRDTGRLMGESVSGETLEVHLGARKFWGERTRPFVGGGLAMVSAHLDSGANKDNDVGLGFWLNTGVIFRIRAHLNLGLDVRLSRASVDLFGVGGQGGGEYVGLLIGYGW